MNYEEEFFRQMVVKNNKSYGGFGILSALVGLSLFLTYLTLKYIVKGVIYMISLAQDKNIQREQHRKAVVTFLKLLKATNNTINFNIIKSHTNRSTGELTQHINFVVFNEEKRTVEIVNNLVNEVLNNTLNICSSKDRDLAGTVITKNYEIEKIQEDLRTVTGEIIVFRNF